MKLENNFLCVEVKEKGAELTRIYNKTTDTEILWNGNPKYWNRQSPVLFPNVGRTWQNTVLIHGVKYPTTAHGFARDTLFTCIKSTQDSVTYMMCSSDEIKEVYPFDFELHISYTLVGKEIKVEWEVKNRSDKTMYYTIGGHPAFMFAKEGEVKSDYILRFPGKTSVAYICPCLQTGTALPEEVHTLKLDNECYPLSEEMFECDTLIFDNYEVKEAWLCHKDGNPYVGIKCPEIANFAIWSKKGAPFVCFEPWAGRCDDKGFDKELSEKTAVNKVEPGKTLVIGYSIEIA